MIIRSSKAFIAIMILLQENARETGEPLKSVLLFIYIAPNKESLTTPMALPSLCTLFYVSQPSVVFEGLCSNCNFSIP